MKLGEVAHNTYHTNVKSWIVKARALAVEQIKHVLHEESDRDPNWFVAKRGSRLRQLVSEILTLALKEVSDEAWSESDFEGRAHSDLLSQAINDVTSSITPFYHQLRTEKIADQLEQSRSTPQEQSTPVEQINTH